MNDKSEILAMLNEEFRRWQELLSGLSEDQLNDRRLPSELSVKDVVAHLMTWQQRTVARMEAALNGGEPQMPNWPKGLDPNSEEDLEPINAWIHETHRDRPWKDVYTDWRATYQRVIELAEAVPEQVLLAPGKFPWLWGQPLAFILVATYDHHHEEHLGPLQAWLADHSKG